ncbi:hypothetical protein B0H16DRAFT_1898129 [Mycena metata]|uniref:Uncharacterized protein n=1 Tax=Mycena metata TaxID=1033252 RepID=A0AAD7MHE3_9AGAR|nr:hypothetical protein B0H16DRAFT_1898129 [Mycena metata]
MIRSGGAQALRVGSKHLNPARISAFAGFLEPASRLRATLPAPSLRARQLFSASRPLLLEKQPGAPTPDAPKKPDRWEELGISKNMKILLLVIFTILGTIETWVWTKGILRWYYGAPKEEEEGVE